MLEKITLFSSIASIVVALFAVIILFLTRKNILDILEKDVILFDKNFELKKQAIEKSLKLVDAVMNDSDLHNDKEFKIEVQDCYNELLCVVSDVKIAREFFVLATAKNGQPNAYQVAQFKLACRHDIGLSNKGLKADKTSRPVPVKEPKQKEIKRPIVKTEPEFVPVEKTEPMIEQVVNEPITPTYTPVQPQPQAQPQIVRPQAMPNQPQQMVRPVQAPQYAQPTMNRPPMPNPQIVQRPQPTIPQAQAEPIRRGRPPKAN